MALGWLLRLLFIVRILVSVFRILDGLVILGCLLCCGKLDFFEASFCEVMEGIGRGLKDKFPLLKQVSSGSDNYVGVMVFLKTEDNPRNTFVTESFVGKVGAVIQGIDNWQDLINLLFAQMIRGRSIDEHDRKEILV
jgi:hypothetical protein